MSAVCLLSAAEVRHALRIRDLTDPSQGRHAIQLLIDAAERALADRWDVPVRRRRANPIVPVEDNYDRLGYPPGAAARDARYSRYLTDQIMLRAHTSAVIPWALEELAAQPVADVVLSCPGIVYRRDAIDRHHVGEPHQLDLWRIRPQGPALTAHDLDELIATLVTTILPGHAWRTTPAVHPYTLHGRQVDVAERDGWVEIGECGLAHPGILAGAGLGPEASGLASGWGLDRLLMLRKGIEDIRLLRSTDPRVAGQMDDLAPYEPVSSMPPASRDLSIAVDELLDAELLGDQVRAALGDQAALVESVQILSATPATQLPPAVLQRLGMRVDQHNVLVRVVLRALERTLTAEQVNILRDRIYSALHRGSVQQWACGHPPK